MSKTVLHKIAAVITVILFWTMIFASKPADDAQKSKVMHKAYRMQIPFIENRGRVGDDKGSFYAKPVGGTLFVGKEGTLTNRLP